MKESNSQPILNFGGCESCSWKLHGFCNEPTNAKSHLIQGENYTGCFDVPKREFFFFDTFKKSIPVPKSSHQHKIKIPSYTLTINSGIKLPDTLNKFTFGVSLGKIIGKRGDLSYKNVAEVKKAFGIPSNSKLALIGTGNDEQLENLWKINETHKIFERISKMGFAWATSLTWSVWEEEFPRPDQIRNQQRNFQSYDLLANLGVPCIPFLFLVEDIDFENATKWLQARPDIFTVAIYARYFKDSNKFYKLLKFLEKIQRFVQRPLKFLIVGIAKADNINLLKNKFNVSFVNGKPYYTAVKGGRICDSKLIYSKSDLPKDEVLKINFLRTFHYCSKDQVSLNTIEKRY